MEIVDLTRAECWSFISEGRLGRLACTKDNRPYVVPLGFAAESPYLYAFTTLGMKTDFLRANPHACVQFDEIGSLQSWTSVIVHGRYEEMERDADCEHAFRLLNKKATWWEPAYVRTITQGHVRSATPVYFRLYVEDLSGRRGATAI